MSLSLSLSLSSSQSLIRNFSLYLSQGHYILDVDFDLYALFENMCEELQSDYFDHHHFVIIAIVSSRNIPVSQIWHSSVERGLRWLSTLMSRDRYWDIRKHLCFYDANIPHMGDPGYDPYEFTKHTIESILPRIRQYWTLGGTVACDEGRVKSKSRFNPYKVRNPAKPLRYAWELVKLCDRGRFAEGFTWDVYPLFGEHAYRDADDDEPKHITKLDGCLKDIFHTGRTVVVDSHYMSCLS